MNRLLRILRGTKPIVLYDTEFTCWKTSNTDNWRNFTQPRHLIQVSAIKVSPFPNSYIIDQREFLIKPNINLLKEHGYDFDNQELFPKPSEESPVISQFFEELTGLKAKNIMEQGIPLEQFYKEFMAFVNGDHAFAYGHDTEILGENLNYYSYHPGMTGHYAQQFLTKFHDIREVFNNNQLVDTSKFSSGTLYKAFDLNEEDVDVNGKQVHNANWDVKSLYRSLQELDKY